jgi:hypothetical protein
MYASCSGAAYVYACCIVGKVRTCGKNVFFSSGIMQKWMKTLDREMEKGPMWKIA